MAFCFSISSMYFYMASSAETPFFSAHRRFCHQQRDGCRLNWLYRFRNSRLLRRRLLGSGRPWGRFSKRRDPVAFSLEDTMGKRSSSQLSPKRIVSERANVTSTAKDLGR